jgi:hypothetical protein
MRKFATVITALVAALALAGCAPTADGNPTSTIDPALIPTAPPANAVQVDPATFDDGFGEWIFKVGDGPTWCTITPAEGSEAAFVTCEQNEASVQYDPIAAPSDCTASYGYQIRLWGGKKDVSYGNHKQAQFTCASSSYSDPSTAKVLANAEEITVGDIRCFVSEVTARCDNGNKNFIVLGPQAWALG